MSLVEEISPGSTGLEQLRALMATGRRPGIAIALDFTLAEVETGYACFTGTPGAHALNPIGSVHGGYVATLLDSACGCAVHSTLDGNQTYTTLELKTAFHKGLGLDTGPVRCEGRITSRGRRVAFAEAKLVDAAGRLYATATSTLLIMERPS